MKSTDKQEVVNFQIFSFNAANLKTTWAQIRAKAFASAKGDLSKIRKYFDRQERLLKSGCKNFATHARTAFRILQAAGAKVVFSGNFTIVVE